MYRSLQFIPIVLALRPSFQQDWRVAGIKPYTNKQGRHGFFMNPTGETKFTNGLSSAQEKDRRYNLNLDGHDQHITCFLLWNMMVRAIKQSGMRVNFWLIAREISTEHIKNTSPLYELYFCHAYTWQELDALLESTLIHYCKF